MKLEKFQEDIYNDMCSIHNEYDIPFITHKDSVATASFVGRNNSFGQTIMRHTILRRPRIFPSYIDNKENELHFLCYAENGAAMAVDCRSQTSSGTTSAKIPTFLLRLLDLDIAISKCMVIEGPELLPIYQDMIMRFANACSSLNEEAKNRLLDGEEIKILDRRVFNHNYTDFSIRNRVD